MNRNTITLFFICAIFVVFLISENEAGGGFKPTSNIKADKKTTLNLREKIYSQIHEAKTKGDEARVKSLEEKLKQLGDLESGKKPFDPAKNIGFKENLRNFMSKGRKAKDEL
jgi:hypothetical protein